MAPRNTGSKISGDGKPRDTKSVGCRTRGGVFFFGKKRSPRPLLESTGLIDVAFLHGRWARKFTRDWTPDEILTRSATSSFASIFFTIASTRLRPGMTAGTKRRQGRGANREPTDGRGMAGILLNGMEENRNGRSPQPSAEWRGIARRFRRGGYNFWGGDGKGYEFSEDGKTEKNLR